MVSVKLAFFVISFMILFLVVFYLWLILNFKLNLLKYIYWDIQHMYGYIGFTSCYKDISELKAQLFMSVVFRFPKY